MGEITVERDIDLAFEDEKILRLESEVGNADDFECEADISMKC